MSTPIVAWLPAAIDACALWRMYIPHLNIEHSRYVFHPSRLPIHEFVEAEIAVVQRQVLEGNFVAMQTLHQHGMKIVYDLDDNLWSVPAFNMAKREFDKRRGGFASCLTLADIITVSTPGLETAVKTAVRPKQEIVVVPNAVDYKLFHKPMIFRDEKEIVIGWSGSNTHSEDLKEAWPALPPILREFSHVRMEFVGEQPPEELMGTGRVRVRNWVPVGEFAPRFTSWGWDIVLAPLADYRFNASKSNIRLLEASAVGAAVLCSDVQPYRQLCQLGGEELMWCLCRRPGDWEAKLRELVVDAGRRRIVAERLRSVAEKFYCIDIIKENWKRVFQQLCG